MTVGDLMRECAGVPESAELILLSDSGTLDSVFAQYDPATDTLVLDGAYRRPGQEVFGFAKDGGAK